MSKKTIKDAHEYYNMLLGLVEKEKLDVRDEINHSKKIIKIRSRTFSGNDLVQIFSNANEGDLFKVWHFKSNDSKYECLQITDLTTKEITHDFEEIENIK